MVALGDVAPAERDGRVRQPLVVRRVMISGTGNRSRADRMQGSPSAGRRWAQSLHANNRYSSGSTTRAASFQSKINDRATVVTWTGCHCRFKTKVGRSSTPFDIIASIPRKRGGCSAGVEPGALRFTFSCASVTPRTPSIKTGPASRPERKARDSNPHAPEGALLSREARPALSGYLPNPINRANKKVDSRGVEPGGNLSGVAPGCKPGVFPLDQPPITRTERAPSS